MRKALDNKLLCSHGLAQLLSKNPFKSKFKSARLEKKVHGMFYKKCNSFLSKVKVDRRAMCKWALSVSLPVYM